MVYHNSKFNYHDIKKASPVCGYYCQWVMEVHTYLVDKYEIKNKIILSKSQMQIETIKLLEEKIEVIPVKPVKKQIGVLSNLSKFAYFR